MIMRQNNKKIPRNFRGIFSHSGTFADKLLTANKFRIFNNRKRRALQDVTDRSLINAVTYIADMAAVSAATVCSSESDGLSFVCSGKNGT